MNFNLINLIRRLRPSWLSIQPICLLCLARVKQGPLAICEQCLNDLPAIIQACSCCGLPIPHSGLCGQCLTNPPHFTQVIAPYRYEFPIAQLISKFKYHGQLALGHLLAELLSKTLEYKYHNGLTKPNYLLAVPLSSNRLKQRGFNQASLLANWLNKKLAIPININTLSRIKDTLPQQSLSAKSRQTNLKNAFQLQNTSLIIDKHLAIVDDVVTTGVTANILASLLLNAGAKQVDIYSIARTPHKLK